MYTYLIFNIVIVIAPFLLSFHERISFYRKWPNYAISTILTGLIFVTWDSIVTELGHWSFNEDHLTGVWVFGIPLEELLFFVTVPYACLFTYEVLVHYTKEWKVPFRRWPYLVTASVFFLTGLVFMDQGYTFIVMVYTAITITVITMVKQPLPSSRHYWLYILATLGLFTVFNMFLTAVPIVTYGPDAIWGGDGLFNGRFFTIPLEDFFYNMSMLSTYLFFYLGSIKLIDLKRGGGNEE